MTPEVEVTATPGSPQLEVSWASAETHLILLHF